MGGFTVLDCGAKLGPHAKVSPGELCAQFAILAGVSFVLAAVGAVALLRVLLGSPRVRWMRTIILGLCTSEAVLSFLAWFAVPSPYIPYAVHILQNLIITTVALNLTTYAVNISRLEHLLPRVVTPVFALLYLGEAAIAVTVFGFGFTAEAGRRCASGVWMSMIAVDAVMTTTFTAAGLFIQSKLTMLVARNSISRAYYRSKKRKLWILITVYAGSAYLSLLFYIVQRAVAEHEIHQHEHVNPCFTFHASTGWALVIERVLVFLIVFDVPVAAIIYQFSSVHDPETSLASPALSTPQASMAASRTSSPYLYGVYRAAPSPGRIQDERHGLLTPPYGEHTGEYGSRSVRVITPMSAT